MTVYVVAGERADLVVVWGAVQESDMAEAASTLLARIIHERFMELCSAHRKTDEYAANVAESLHHQLDTLEIEFPLFIYKTRLS